MTGSRVTLRPALLINSLNGRLPICHSSARFLSRSRTARRGSSGGLPNVETSPRRSTSRRLLPPGRVCAPAVGSGVVSVALVKLNGRRGQPFSNGKGNRDAIGRCLANEERYLRQFMHDLTSNVRKCSTYAGTGQPWRSTLRTDQPSASPLGWARASHFVWPQTS